MATVVVFETGKEPQLLESVNTPDFCDIPENKRVYSEDGLTWGTNLTKQELLSYVKPGVIINPQLKALESVPRKYWKRDGLSVVEMSATEKAAVDAAEKAGEVTMVTDLQISVKELALALVASGVVTKAQLVNAIKQRRGLA